MHNPIAKCPECKQEFYGEEDRPIFRLQYCNHYVCVMCAWEHRKECKKYWRECKDQLTRKLEWGML